jgi:hypothetical protein
MDIFFRNSEKNIDKIRKALIEFGFPDEDLKEALFVEPGNIIQFGVSPLRVDIINEIDGVSFDEAISNSVRGRYGEIEVSFIGRIELIKNKIASGRGRQQNERTTRPSRKICSVDT